ncbi:MAG: outer membrane beta-barrel protein [Bacteroidota bacterium]
MKYGVLFLFMGVFHSFSQVVNTGMTANYDSVEVGKVNIGGLIDTYYGFDFNQPETSDRPYFVSSPRHNEININLAYIELQYINERVRGRLVPGFGTYINSNYINEKGSLKNLIEANVGVRLSKKRDIWVDAGILGSPFTNETAVSKDHLMYTRSFAPEYVPYYLSGVKISMPLGKKIKAYGYILNGWQVISDVNNPLSVGTQIEYRPSNTVLINWDTYIGDEYSKATPENRTRYFTDVYLIYNSSKKLSLTSCAYVGLQDRKDSLGIESRAFWWQANVIASYQFNKTVSLAARLEYFNDLQSVQVVPITSVNGFDSYSAGLCMNVKIGGNALFRLEGRTFYSDRNMFISADNQEVNWSNLLITNLTVWF